MTRTEVIVVGIILFIFLVSINYKLMVVDNKVHQIECDVGIRVNAEECPTTRPIFTKEDAFKPECVENKTITRIGEPSIDYQCFRNNMLLRCQNEFSDCIQKVKQLYLNKEFIVIDEGVIEKEIQRNQIVCMDEFNSCKGFMEVKGDKGIDYALGGGVDGCVDWETEYNETVCSKEILSRNI